MSIRVEHDKLIVEKWIERIHYNGPNPIGHESRAIIVTDTGTYTLVGERADALKDHPKANLPRLTPGMDL